MALFFLDDTNHGKMSFYSYVTKAHKDHSIYYIKELHNGVTYDAILVNADDEGTKYAMMREIK